MKTEQNYEKSKYLSFVSQIQKFCPVVYWPLEVGTSKQFGTIIISNNISGVDFKNRNILFRELELSVEDSDYVSLLFQQMLLCAFNSNKKRITNEMNFN